VEVATVIRSFNGRTPEIAESAFVSEAAYVVGDVRIGENSGVWPGAVVRGDFATIRIGSQTMIEDNCVLHTGVPMEIGDNVIVGHSVVVHGSKIGQNTLIGSNATILEGAIIGENCIVGASCLVSQGMVVEDNCLVVGVPATVKGRVSREQLEELQSGLQSYVELIEQCKANGV
jgi:carbonic anhydrase/acetyltransferase-like protein (isoleucine patch superfamily)